MTSPSPEGARPAVPVLRLRTRMRRVEVDGHEVQLTPMEFDLLVYLMRHRDEVHTRHALLSRVWGWSSPDDSRTIDTHIARLRRKLGSVSDAIQTLHRVGYLVLSDRVAVVHDGGVDTVVSDSCLTG